jgi:hypothetical protein
VKSADTTSTNVALWVVLLAGPLAWTMHELASYMLVKVACESGVGWLLHGLTLLALALATAGFLIAARVQRYRFGTPRSTPDVLATVGALGSVLFAFAIVMEGLPNTLVSPCL